MKYKIAIIEDVAMHSLGISETIIISGNEVVETFINSQTFFEKYKELEPLIDILMVDINLSRSQSEMNGYNIILRLAKEQYEPKLVIVTDNEDFSSIKAAKIHGADGFVGKNIYPDQLAVFFDKVYNSDDFIVANPTLNSVFRNLLNIDIGQNNMLSFPQKFKDILLAMFRGKKGNEIVETILRKELNDKIHSYGGTFDIRPLSIAEFLYKQSDCKELNDKIKKIINETIDDVEKLNRIFSIKKCKHLKDRNKTYIKLKENLLLKVQKEIAEILNLPNSKKETLIVGAVLTGILTKNDLFD